jgi:hypothetical protein
VPRLRLGFDAPAAGVAMTCAAYLSALQSASIAYCILAGILLLIAALSALVAMRTPSTAVEATASVVGSLCAIFGFVMLLFALGDAVAPGAGVVGRNECGVRP